MSILRYGIAVAIGLSMLAGCEKKRTADTPAPPSTTPSTPADAQPAPADRAMVELQLNLPKPVFKATPKNIPPGIELEKPTGTARKLPMVPAGTMNVAKGKPVTSSDSEPIIGTLSLVTDGDNAANEGSYVELGFGTQWAQIDLGSPKQIHAIVVWHFHMEPRIYRDVVVQLADDAAFTQNVRTVFNSDRDGSSNLGVGKDYEYFETYEGKLIEVPGEAARYVRLYSNGSTSDDMNHYTEVQVYGKDTP